MSTGPPMAATSSGITPWLSPNFCFPFFSPHLGCPGWTLLVIVSAALISSQVNGVASGWLALGYRDRVVILPLGAQALHTSLFLGCGGRPERGVGVGGGGGGGAAKVLKTLFNQQAAVSWATAAGLK